MSDTTNGGGMTQLVDVELTALEADVIAYAVRHDSFDSESIAKEFSIDSTDARHLINRLIARGWLVLPLDTVHEDALDDIVRTGPGFDDLPYAEDDDL